MGLRKEKNSETLEREILKRLYSGPVKTVDLVEEISFVRKVSVQGVYKALRQLRNEEVVTIHNHTVSISLVWVDKEQEKLEFIKQSYRSIQFLDTLQNGRKKRIQFTFKTLNETDLFWTHAYLLLAEKIGNDAQTYSIQPHDWYMYVRSDTDSFWIKKHRESNRISRTILTHPGVLDHMVIRKRKEQLGNLFEYTLRENPYNQNSCTYYNIIGSFIFTAEFDLAVAKKLDTFVEDYEALPLSEVAQKEIISIVSTKGVFRLSIEHNEKKAMVMKEKAKKYFEF